MNKTIAIDGPAGSGKSSIAKLFAKSIGFFYLDTGSLYRTVAYYFKNNNISSNSTAEIEGEFKNIKISFDTNNEVFLNHENVSNPIRSKEISSVVAGYSQSPEIRNFIRILQKNFAAEKNIVIDGRDIGTVVFPDAFCKFYLDANIEIRAKRRHQELIKMGSDVDIEEIKNDIIRRDYMDRSRKQSPLKIAPDAIVIDTSDLTIDEVLNSMISYYNKQVQLNTHEGKIEGRAEFLNSLKEYESPTDLKNQFLEATVIKVNDTVVVDIGTKLDAYIDREEVALLDPKPEVGEKINVVVIERGPTGIQVSRKKAEMAKSFTQLDKAKNEGSPVSGKVMKKVKGGFIVDIMSNNAFCPFSEYSPRRVNHKEQIGKVEEFLVIEHSIDRLVVSRRRLIEKIYQENRERYYSQVVEGQVVRGKVVVLLGYGIFVELEPGVDVMVRNRDISWKRFNHPKEVVKLNDEIELKILEIDHQNFKMITSHKELEENPFDMFVSVHKIGDVVHGKVRKIHEYGAFVEIADGVSGLLKVSDLNWLRRIEHPSQVLSKNQELDLKVIRIDKPNRRIDLGLKQMDDNPWNSINKDYPIHTLVNAKVTLVVSNGIYTVVDDKVDAFLHIKDSNLDEDVNLEQMYKKNDIIEAQIIRINPSKHRLELGLFKSTGDPWKNIETNYGKKDIIYGEVTEILENGVNVKISEEVSGFCHISQVSEKETKDIVIGEHLKVGEQYPFFIQSINSKKQDLKLSRHEYLLSQKKKDPKTYLKSSESQSQITISDLLK